MKCGGKKMQTGGGQYLLDGSWQPGSLKNGVWEDEGPAIPKPAVPSYNPFGSSPWLPNQQSPQTAVIQSTTTTQPVQHEREDGDRKREDGRRAGEDRNQREVEEPHTDIKQDPYFKGLGKRMLSTATTGLQWLSGIVERNRQNQYQQNQLSSLGQLDPLPISNFQPTAYNLYARYGGKLSKYQRGGKSLPPVFPGDSIPQSIINPLAHRLWRNGENYGSLDSLNIMPFNDRQYQVKPTDKEKIKKEFDNIGWWGRTWDAAMPYEKLNLSKFKKGGLTPNKAREILHDGTAHGNKLTDKQRKYFGAMSKGHTNYRGNGR